MLALVNLIVQIGIRLSSWWFSMPPLPVEDKPPPRAKQRRKPIKGLPYDVNSLSDGDLARQLRNYDQVVGPITNTTRPLYQKKLIKILVEEVKNPETFQQQLKPPLQQSTAPKAWEFSDNEEEEESTKPVSARRNDNKKDEVVMIEDNSDAVNRKNVHVALQDTPPKESAPKFVKTETIVSESYLETRKRVVANNKSVDSAIKSQQLPTPVKAPPAKHVHVDSGSFEWKAVLVILAIITSILLVYYFMEGNPDTPRLKDKVE